MDDLIVHIESIEVHGGLPEPDGIAAALAEHLGGRLHPDQLAAVGAAIAAAIARPTSAEAARDR